MYKILFPSEPFTKNVVDSSYLEEYNTCKLMGIVSYLFDYDEFIESGKLSSNINYDDECVIIYRGWMMKSEQYEIFYSKILQKSNSKIKLKNNPVEYKNCHCFPYIYDDIKHFTPKIVVLNKYDTHFDYKHALKNIDFDFFIKDYVKSVKTEKGVDRIDKNITCIQLQKKIEDFRQERGNLFTGGIVLKEFVDLKKINGKTNEWRLFFMDGKFLCMMQNSNLNTHISPPSDMISKVRELLKYKSNFFTVDFAQLEDDSWTVIETGDGSVSGFPDSFNPIGFYNNLLQFDDLTILNYEK